MLTVCVSVCLGISRAEVDRALRARWGLASSDTYVRSAAVRVYAHMCWGSCLGVSAEEHCTLPFALFGWFGTHCLRTYVVWVDGCTIVTHAWLFPPTFCPQYRAYSKRDVVMKRVVGRCRCARGILTTECLFLACA